MKARHIFMCLALSLLGTGLQAQNDELPQVFSPNAAELGKYGKIPVSYFNGLPNISIPLTGKSSSSRKSLRQAIPRARNMQRITASKMKP